MTMKIHWMEVLGLLTVTIFSLAAVASELKQPMIDKPAPSFALKDLGGKVVSLEEQRGKFVVLHFAASW